MTIWYDYVQNSPSKGSLYDINKSLKLARVKAIVIIYATSSPVLSLVNGNQLSATNFTSTVNLDDSTREFSKDWELVIQHDFLLLWNPPSVNLRSNPRYKSLGNLTLCGLVMLTRLGQISDLIQENVPWDYCSFRLETFLMFIRIWNPQYMENEWKLSHKIL